MILRITRKTSCLSIPEEQLVYLTAVGQSTLDPTWLIRMVGVAHHCIAVTGCGLSRPHTSMRGHPFTSNSR